MNPDMGHKSKIGTDSQTESTSTSMGNNTNNGKSLAHSQIYYYELLRHRAIKRVYRLFRVGKFEMWVLLSFQGYLTAIGRDKVSKLTASRQVCPHPRDKRRWFINLDHLRSKGLIVDYSHIRTGGLSYGISDLGLSVLRCYCKEIEKLSGLYDVVGIAERDAYNLM